MKKTTTKSIGLWLLAAALFAPLCGRGDFLDDDLSYRSFEHGSARQVYVSGLKNKSATRITIPSTVVYESSAGSDDDGNPKLEHSTYHVTSIGENAFYGCTSLESVTIPGSVTSIGASAFYGCTSLTSVKIPNSVTAIGEAAFCYCFALTSVTIPNSVTEIGDFVFCASGLTSVAIPNSVTSIGESAFECCDELKAVKIPDSVARIGSAAFKECESLAEVVIPSSVQYVGSEAFRRCSGLNAVTIHGAETYFGSKAFAGCKNIKRVAAAEGVFSQGLSGVFASAKNCIERVDALDGVSYVSFAGLSALEYVSIPASVTYMDGWNFTGCQSLATVSIASANPNYISRAGCVLSKDGTELVACYNGSAIPTSVTKIGTSAFRGREDVTRIRIPDSVVEIGDGAFAFCSALESVDLSRALLSIGDAAFYCCNRLARIAIPDSVAGIGKSAFEGCSALKSIELGTSVEAIGKYGFMDCIALNEITIPASVVSIETWAFCDCENLLKVIFLGDAPTTDASAFEGVKSGCVASVREPASGFPTENANWNGLRIKYFDEPDAFPEISDDAGVVAALRYSVDLRLAENIKSKAAYDDFRAWAISVGAAAVKASGTAWLSFAVGATGLVAEPQAGDLAVDAVSVGADGNVEAVFALDGADIGAAAVEERLKTVFGAEGAATPDPSAFSSDGLGLSLAPTGDGRVRATVTPPDGATAYFLRLRMK